MRSSSSPSHRSRIWLVPAALAGLLSCAHDQGYDVGRLGDETHLPVLEGPDARSELSSDQFLQLVDRSSWPHVVIQVPRSVTVHDPSYMSEAAFKREGQPWNAYPTLDSARHAEPGGGDDINAWPGDLAGAAVDLVLMPIRMIVGPHPHDALHGPAADWDLTPAMPPFDPAWFQPMGTAESPNSSADDG